VSTDFEQRLRAEMEQVAVRSRPGLVREAYRGYRGKRRMTRAVVAGGTAAAIAAGTAVGVAATTTSPTAIPVQTTAYVVSHVRSALAAPNRMAYTRETFSVPHGPLPDNAFPYPNPISEWSYGSRYRMLSESASGQPRAELWVRTSHGKPTLIAVNYQHRWWERISYGVYPPVRRISSRISMCRAPEIFLITSARQTAAADWKQIVESGLRCGLVRVTGRQRVEGIDAIKLTGAGIILWVDPRTYLPVQMAGKVQRVALFGASIGKTAKETIWIHFRWLLPTRASLAQLTGTIPPGFRQLSRTTSPWYRPLPSPDHHHALGRR
jgi:hypothetical protein